MLSPKRQNGTIEIYSFALALVLLVCCSYLANRFINKWDGHFGDRRGCTTLQGFHGRLFKVNSCDNIIENLGAYNSPKIPDNNKDFLPLPPLPQLNPPQPQPPKILPQKNQPAPAPKQNPYMI